MKYLTFFLTLLTFTAATAKEKQSLTPKLSNRFGEIITATIEFVEKPKTYYAQNIVKAKSFAKVKAVNGKTLDEPIIMEYRCAGEFTQGVTYTLKTYEDIESSGVNREWDGVIRQFNYRISHFLRLKIEKHQNGK